MRTRRPRSGGRSRWIPRSPMRTIVSDNFIGPSATLLPRKRSLVRSTNYTRKQTKALHRRSEEHTSELQSPCNLVCRLLLEKKKKKKYKAENQATMHKRAVKTA